MKIKLNILVASCQLEYSRQLFKQDTTYIAKAMTRSLKKHTKNWRQFHPKRKPSKHWSILIPEALITATMAVYGLFFFALTWLSSTSGNMTLTAYFGGLGMIAFFMFAAFFYWTGLYNTAQKHKVKIRFKSTRFTS